MKTLIYLTLAGLTVSCAIAQTQPAEHEWKVRLIVVDDIGQPVAAAKALVSYTVPPPPDIRYAAENIEGFTDTNGVFTASHQGPGCGLGLNVGKIGYYGLHVPYDIPNQYDPAKWNVTTNLLLKRMIHPIPMYAKRIDKGPPVLDKPTGYDMMAGDWVAPDGKGAIADIIFTRTYSTKSSSEYESKLTVSFPHPGDGIQVFDAPFRVDEGSALRSPYEAPENGYQPTLTRLNSSHPGQPLIFEYDAKRNYFVRVRTVLDEKGNVKSALYGKIYGDFMHICYYLNPTPNSRNVEFDPKQNLLKGIQSFEQVTTP